MRIAVISWTRSVVGGTEAYLADVLPRLIERGYEVGFWYEVDDASAGELINLPPGMPSWCVERLGVEKALESLRAWRPKLLYAHGLLSHELETRTLEVAPAVFFAHGYYGTCISGAKTWKSPRPVPCSRRFDWKCLAHYYPHRCGGRSPVTMVRLYRIQSVRRRLLDRYKAVLTHSEHMREEFIRNGYPAERVFTFRYYVGDQAGTAVPNGTEPTGTAPEAPAVAADGSLCRERRLLFLGRMDRLKGGGTLVRALPRVKAAFRDPLRVTFAGDGPDRARWEQDARRVSAGQEGLTIEFVGWVPAEPRRQLLEHCDLLVLPSLWPEPFGRVGLEAGLYGVPVIAFAVGGIPEWLHNGVNGYLAAGKPPTSKGLAEAILKGLADTRPELREGARRVAIEFSIENHLAQLELAFAYALDGR